jgi:hypothetical protein
MARFLRVVSRATTAGKGWATDARDLSSGTGPIFA